MSVVESEDLVVLVVVKKDSVGIWGKDVVRLGG